MNPLISIIMSSFTAATGGVFLKKSHEKRFLINIAIGIILYGLSIIFLMIAFTSMDLSIAFNISALTYIFAFIYGVTIFKEKVTIIKTIGLILIILGITLLMI